MTTKYVETKDNISTNSGHFDELSYGTEMPESRVHNLPPIDFEADHFPYCIVWTPIPLLTWLCPIIGHMGICTSNGIIRDFAGAYYVSTDNMAFGRPTRYLRLNPQKVVGGRDAWDDAVAKASVTYASRIHNLCCDNCHSHVATALNYMRYNNTDTWNMCILAFWLFIFGRYTGCIGFMKTWVPFALFVGIIIFISVYL